MEEKTLFDRFNEDKERFGVSQAIENTRLMFIGFVLGSVSSVIGNDDAALSSEIRSLAEQFNKVRAEYKKLIST